MTDLTLAALTDEVRRLNTEKGWRAEHRSVRELTALIVSEISEALDAYRRWELDDATESTDHDCPTPVDGLCMCPAKPEGVGPELADVIIRTVDACDILGRHLDGDLALADLAPMAAPRDVNSFAEHLDWLADLTRDFKIYRQTGGPWLLRAVATVATKYGIDLTAEVRRKMDHNWTRAFRHGGRLL
jgi:NTP pyrophosphatase (non-canonical NTP hydrolase)